MQKRTASKYTLEELRRLIAPVISKYNVDRAYVFGSYARGEADDRSDVDIRIDANGLPAFDLCGIMARLEKALNMPVDVIPTSSMSQGFLDSIREEEVLVYER